MKWQARAIAMYSGDKDKSDGEARLMLYRARKPYHETSP